MADVRFLAFSDLHAHSFNYGSSRVYVHDTAYGQAYTNSRLVDAIEVMKQMRRYCYIHRIHTVLFGGDLFHTHGTLKADVLSLVAAELKNFSATGIEVIMIPGNHDYLDKYGHFHSLATLASSMLEKSRVRVLDMPVYTTTTDRTICLVAVPYIEDRARLMKELNQLSNIGTGDRPKVLLAHLGFQGARVGSDYILVKDDDLSVNDIDWSKFDLCLFGHYHQHQQLFQNGYYIGAPLQHNWSDAGTTRGFLDIEGTLVGTKYEWKITQIESDAPKFHVIRANDDTSHIKERDFVTYVKEPGEETPNLTFKSTTLEIKETAVSKEELTVELDASKLSPLDMIDPWVDSTAGEEREDLKKLGKELLAEVLKDSL